MSTNALLPWSSRPIFVSSTFADMQAERDHLRRHVVPRLEEALRRRRHHLEWLDLRQGVEPGEGEVATTKEEREQLVLKVCLAGVRDSRPFLIVLLGDRYGWVPPRERAEAAVREAGYQGDISGRSVTALEIEYGILKSSPDQRHRSFFYLREPLLYDQMSPATAALYSEQLNHADADSPSKWSALQALKARLRSDPELAPRVRSYSARWDPVLGAHGGVAGLEAWGEQVFNDLWAELDPATRDFAAAPAPTWEDTERVALAEFIEHRSRDFTGRDDTVTSLLALATSPAAEGAPWGACVTGPPGAGKSALFAKLAKKLSATPGTLLLANAAGGTLRGAGADSMLRRWIGELAAHLGVNEPLAPNASPDDVDRAFASHLGRASARNRVVVLLDALDQAEPTPRAQHLTWRPKLWPLNARLIATALPGVPAQALSQWAGVEEIDLPALSPDAARAIARGVWKRYHVPWTEIAWEALAEKKLPDGTAATGNPLWTTLACEQLALLDADDFARASRDFKAQFGDDIQARLAALRRALAAEMPPDVPGLYRLLLALAEKIHGAAPARTFAVAIALSHSGWRERDLTGLVPRLAAVLFPEQPPVVLTALELAGLRRTFRAHLVARGAESCWDFAHAQMRVAVGRHAFADEMQRRAFHSAVSNYLETLPPDDSLILHERMRHLIGERNTLRAARYYATLEASASSSLEERVGSSWTLVEWIAAGETFGAGIGRSPVPNSHLAWVLSWLDAPSLVPEEIGRLGRNLIFGLLDKLQFVTSLPPQLALAWACAGAFAQLAAADPSNAGWQRDLSVSHNKVGDVLLAQGDLAGAVQAFRASLSIRERLAAADPSNAGWQRDLSVSHNKVGDVLLAQGDLAGAVQAFRASLSIRERLAAADPSNAGWQRDLSVSHNKVGDVLLAQGDLAGAVQAFRASHAILSRLAAADPSNAGWQRDLSVSHDRVGDVLLAQGDLAGAVQAFRAGLVIAERLAAADPSNAGWQRDLSVSHNKVGDVLLAQGDLAGAVQAFRATHAILSRLAAADPSNAGWQRDVAVSHYKLAGVARHSGDTQTSTEHWRACHVVLNKMRQTRRHLDRPMQELLIALDAAEPADYLPMN